VKYIKNRIILTLLILAATFALSHKVPDQYGKWVTPGLIALALIYLLSRKFFKPEKYIDKWGYVVLTKVNELEHRYVAKQLLKRNLVQNEVVHHINGEKTDNRIENLCLMNREKHEHFHAWLSWKKKKFGYYPSIANQEKILEQEYAGTLLKGISSQPLEPEEPMTAPAPEKKVIVKDYEVDSRKRQLALFEELRKERKRIAEQKNLPVYLIFNDRTLHEMSKLMPSSEDMMLHINGVGPTKMNMYGWNFLTIIKIFKENEIQQRNNSETA
jgi:superfamily II DNA helicase RecQ